MDSKKVSYPTSRQQENTAHSFSCYGLVIQKPKHFSKFDLDRAEEYAQLLDLIWKLGETRA